MTFPMTGVAGPETIPALPPQGSAPWHGRTLADCIGSRASSPALATGAPPSLSGLAETSFATFIGTAPQFADTVDGAVQFVYVRANYNANMNANGGRLPLKPTTYVSKGLVQAVLTTYRELSGTGTVRHLTPKTIATTSATDVYNQVTSRLLKTYPNLHVDTTRTILREFYYAVVGQSIHVDLLLPAVQRYPTDGAAGMYTLDEQRRSIQEDRTALKKEQERETFLGKIGAAVANLVSAPGELASAATTTAKIAGTGIVVVGLSAVGLLSYGIYRKVREFDANAAFRENQATVRSVAPGVARAIVRKGM